MSSMTMPAHGSGRRDLALQWDTSIAAGGDFLISKQKFLQVPEPSVLALISLGAVAYALHRRRQSQHGLRPCLTGASLRQKTGKMA